MLKASLQPLKSNADQSFASYWVKANSFGFHWHYHPEVELCYVQRGAGTRMVGDSVRAFSEGDLVLLGGNLPHTWISQQYNNDASDNMEVFVIQFLPELLQSTWLALPEFKNVSALLKNAAQGLFFTDATTLKAPLMAVAQSQGLDKLLALLALLNSLSLAAETQKLASHGYAPYLSHENKKRMQAIFGYIHAHFTEALTLRQIADLACLNEASFCRYFKKNTGQTLTEYVNDLRINQACQLLLETTMPIVEIAERAGFSSFTNFNKSFTKRKKMPPRDFRKSIV